MPKKYVIFGTGTGGRRIRLLTEQCTDICVECFLDNYPKADEFLSLPVIKAELFLREKNVDEYIFIVASVYREEIVRQLLSYGVAQDCIWFGTDIVMNNWERYKQQLVIEERADFRDSTSIIFDCGAGFGLGGVEKWTYELVRKLKKEQYEDVLMFSIDNETIPPSDLKENAQKIKGVTNFFDFDVESVRKIEETLLKQMPCIVYAAHVNNFLYAACVLKEKYPDKITIVSVVHGGVDWVIKENETVMPIVDYVLCVSPDSRKVLMERCHVTKEKVLFKETPVRVDDVLQREYTLDMHKPIKIAYASRLEKVHKHSELLEPLVEELERRDINYILDIAGEGVLYSRLNDFVNSQNLQHKVNLLGRIDYEEMRDFWRSHDISVNLSECEGCSLAMLETMSNGTVPIFTDVFSSKHFIQDDWNGYVVSYGDIDEMVSHIQYLSENRMEIRNMGVRAYEKIRNLCNMDSYYQYIQEHIISK